MFHKCVSYHGSSIENTATVEALTKVLRGIRESIVCVGFLAEPAVYHCSLNIWEAFFAVELRTIAPERTVNRNIDINMCL